jgi:hypothetical protein
MARVKLAFFVALVAIALVFCNSEESGEGEGEIEYDLKAPCTFVGSWYIRGESVDLGNQLTVPGEGGVRVYEDNDRCFMDFMMVTPFVSFCQRSRITLKTSNYMYFDDFDNIDVAVFIFLTGEEHISLQAFWTARDGAFSGVSVPGVEPSDILDDCSSKKRYFIEAV